MALQPGAWWHYGMGLDVAARLIAAITDQPLGVFVAERIVAPLGMADTASRSPSSGVIRWRHARTAVNIETRRCRHVDNAPRAEF